MWPFRRTGIDFLALPLSIRRRRAWLKQRLAALAPTFRSIAKIEKEGRSGRHRRHSSKRPMRDDCRGIWRLEMSFEESASGAEAHHCQCRAARRAVIPPHRCSSR